MPELGDIEIIRDSMINVRPKQGNRSRSIEDPGTRVRITEIVGRLVA